ncbi:MAG: hypothetical protein ACRDGG_01610 [Anaerolineae bacterium]
MKRSHWMLTALGMLLAACAPRSVSAPVTSIPSPASKAEDVQSAPALDATAAPEQETSVPLPDGPLAPTLTNETWLNSDPLSPGDLSGKVVLIDFWTFG